MKIFMVRYLRILSLFGRNLCSRVGGCLNFIKTKDGNFVVFSACSHFLSLMFLFQCVADRYPQESCKNECLFLLQDKM